MEYPITNEYFQESARTADEAKQMLVMANRILSHEGVFDAFGHVSVRNPENPETFFISRAISPEFVTIDDILELNFQGEVICGKAGCKPFGERAIHCAVYEARPDVNCVAHPHPLELIPFASTDIPLRSIYHQDVTFYDGIPVFKDLPPECGLLINTLEIGREMAKQLGMCRGILIRNHGVVVVGESVARTVYSTITMRDNAKCLLQAISMGAEIHYITKQEAEQGTYQQFCKLGLSRSWNYWRNNAIKAYPDLG